MKNSIMIFITFVSVTLSAQRVGIKAGYSHSKPAMDVFFEEDATGSVSGVPGFHVGPYVDLKLAKILSMEIGLQFESKGFKYQYSSAMDAISVHNGEAQVYYLQIPLSFKLGYSINSSSKIYGIFGSYLAFGVGGTDQRVVVENGVEKPHSGEYWQGSEYFSGHSPIGIFQKVDLGVDLGVGYEINDLQFSATYEMGLKDIAVIFDQIDVYNRVLKISVGYSFPL